MADELRAQHYLLIFFFVIDRRLAINILAVKQFIFFVIYLFVIFVIHLFIISFPIGAIVRSRYILRADLKSIGRIQRRCRS